MIESHFQEWLALLIRWGHMIAGIAWIGASFYFNWLENQLERRTGEDIAGDLWAVHGGGFYYLQKYAVAPPDMPRHLHWFKWEAYATWISGLALLIVVYYWDARSFMLNPSVADISEALAITIGLASLALSWTWYDLLCRSPLARSPLAFSAAMLAWFGLLAFVLGGLLSGRAAYIHVGAAIGTIMVANVFRVIIPAQKELVSALEQNRAPDPGPGQNALQRSRHNNYLTLPVLFIMISSHYPMTYGHPQAWLVLVVISVAGVLVRHYFNIRHQAGRSWAWLLAGLLLLAVMAWWSRPQAVAGADSVGPRVSTASAWRIVNARCVACHAREPSNAGFSSAPQGIELDSVDMLRVHAERVYTAVVITRTMPLGNLTNMTEQERTQLANWFEGFQAGHTREPGADD
ncbi:MAG: urate hydroxylase PuuD [Xanthomonadales bacterium]|nr:urate hydroxylase PuuD [Xanthomonadales bacterium]